MTDPIANDRAKSAVAEFWEQASCGEVYADGAAAREFYDSQSKARYELEPFIFGFAQFPEGRGRDVLEIGVGMGADHLEWAKSHPRSLTGIDLTERAVAFTRERLGIYGLSSDVRQGDAERLPFSDDSFDIVYSWGVLHHSPDTPRAVDEVYRVLRPGGAAKIMVYNRRSIVGLLLWIRYALLAGRPGRSLGEVYSEQLESPGTKAYTEQEIRRIFAKFSRVETSVQLSVGDLMEGAAGQRHQGAALAMAKRVWPRRIIRKLLPRYGLFLLISAVK